MSLLIYFVSILMEMFYGHKESREKASPKAEAAQ